MQLYKWCKKEQEGERFKQLHRQKMVAKNKNVALPPPDPETEECENGSLSNACHSETGLSSSSSSEGFYEKLCKVNESTGLSLIFNFRDTSLDLHLFYKTVTGRGGYHQVTGDGGWGEIASALNIKSGVPMSPTQLQKLYASLLYQFEQTYHYRTPGKKNQVPSKEAAPTGHTSIDDYSSCSPRKRKHCDSSSHLSAVHYSSDDSPSKNNFGQISTGPSTEEKKLNLQPQVKEKEMKKDPNTPLGPRSGYQIFMKIERSRLKRIHGESPNGQIREMAIGAWRNLSEDDKKPYVEASRKDKERYIREMAAYNQRKIQKETKSVNTCGNTNQKFIEFALPSERDEDYHHVISQLEAGNDCQNMPSAIQKVIDFAQTDGDYHVTLQPEGGDGCQLNTSSTKQNVIDFAKPLLSEGDYHVTLQPDAEIAYVSDESMVEIAIGMMKNAQPNDPIFQINWDEYCGSLDIAG